jgi:hypothetical protein
MEPVGKYTRSGGCLLAFSVMAGVAVGTILHQPSIGFLAGAALGLFLVLVVFVLDRRRGSKDL